MKPKTLQAALRQYLERSNIAHRWASYADYLYTARQNGSTDVFAAGLARVAKRWMAEQEKK